MIIFFNLVWCDISRRCTLSERELWRRYAPGWSVPWMSCPFDEVSLDVKCPVSERSFAWKCHLTESVPLTEVSLSLESFDCLNENVQLPLHCRRLLQWGRLLHEYRSYCNREWYRTMEKPLCLSRFGRASIRKRNATSQQNQIRKLQGRVSEMESKQIWPLRLWVVCET